MSESLVLELPAPTSGQLLRLEFEWSGDRWLHRWLLVDPTGESGAPLVLLSSIEGTPEQVWPPAPPLQDISRHELPSGPAILGVGMAGIGHWSASFSVEHSPDVEHSPKEGLAVKADLACLQKQPANSTSAPVIASNYGFAEGVVVKPIDEGFEIGVPGRPTIELRPLRAPGCDSGLELGHNCLSVMPESSPSGAPGDAKGQATRWGYWVGWKRS